MYFSTLPARSELPRRDARCASLVTPRRFEPRPENGTANHTLYPPDRCRGPCPTRPNTGTTDEIIRWASCKRGLDENIVRAVADEESEWHRSEDGDNGESFGIMQVRDHTSDGHHDLGGYPDTLHATALNVDLYGAWERSCLDGDFYDGGDWLYNRKKVVNDVWGCVGAWFSGDWHDRPGAQQYIGKVKAILADRGWFHLSPGP
jgi:hypothetical protein